MSQVKQCSAKVVTLLDFQSAGQMKFISLQIVNKGVGLNSFVAVYLLIFFKYPSEKGLVLVSFWFLNKWKRIL